MDAIKSKEAVLLGLKDINYDKILDAARSRWVSYEAKEKQCLSVGIDGSWNKRSFQGLDFYVVDAVAVDSTNNIKAVEWYYGLGVTRAEILIQGASFQEYNPFRNCSTLFFGNLNM